MARTRSWRRGTYWPLPVRKHDRTSTEPTTPSSPTALGSESGALSPPLRPALPTDSALTLISLPPELLFEILSCLLSPLFSNATRHPLLKYIPLSTMLAQPVFQTCRALRNLLLSWILPARTQAREGMFLSVPRVPPVGLFSGSLRGAVVVLKENRDDPSSLWKELQTTDDSEILDAAAIEAVVFISPSGSTGVIRPVSRVAQAIEVALWRICVDGDLVAIWLGKKKPTIDGVNGEVKLPDWIACELVSVAIAMAAHWVDVMLDMCDRGSVRFVEIPIWIMSVLIGTLNDEYKASVKVILDTAVRKAMGLPMIGTPNSTAAMATEAQSAIIEEIKEKGAKGLMKLFSHLCGGDARQHGGVMFTACPLFILGLFFRESIPHCFEPEIRRYKTVFRPYLLGHYVEDRLKRFFGMLNNFDLAGLQLPGVVAWRSSEVNETVGFEIGWRKLRDEMEKSGWRGLTLDIVSRAPDVKIVAADDNDGDKDDRLHPSPDIAHVFPLYILRSLPSLTTLSIVTLQACHHHLCHILHNPTHHFPSAHTITLTVSTLCSIIFDTCLSNNLTTPPPSSKLLTLHVRDINPCRVGAEAGSIFSNIRRLSNLSRGFTTRTGWHIRFQLTRKISRLNLADERVLVVTPNDRVVRFESRYYFRYALQVEYVVVREEELSDEENEKGVWGIWEERKLNGVGWRKEEACEE